MEPLNSLCSANLVPSYIHSILILRSTARGSQHAAPSACARGGSVSTTATQDASVRRALPGLIFYFFDFFCWLEILCQNIYFQILYLKIFCLKFFSTNFFSFTKFCTMIFLPKFIDLSKFFHEIFLFRVFLLIFSLKALFKIVCISLVNFLFI